LPNKPIDLPVDRNWHPIDVLKYGDTVALTVGAASSRSALPTGVIPQSILRLASNTDCYVALGGSTVEATTSDVLFLSGVEYITVAKDQTHIAVIQDSAGGALTVTEVF